MPRRTLIMAAVAVGLAVWNGAARASYGAQPMAEPKLVPLEPMLVPIVDHGEMIGRLELRAMWQARDEEAAKAAETRLPQLRAALIEGASDHARIEATPSRAVDPEAIARRLQASAARQGFSGSLLVLEATTRAG